MEQLMAFESEMTAQKREAVELHFEIKKNGDLAAGYLCEFAASLKKMRDKRLYTELDFESFDDYVEQAVGIRKRQAYNYIQALEALGYKELQLNANLGITKLQLLSKLTVTERQELIESGAAGDSSVQELKTIIEGLRSENEQLRFDQQKERADAEQHARQIEQLKSDLEVEKNKPAATVSRELTAEELKELTAGAVRDEAAAQKREKERELAALKKEHESEKKGLEKKAQDLEKQLKESKKQLAEFNVLKEIHVATEAKVDELEKQAKLAANPEVLRFGFYFEEAQKNIAEMKKIINGADEATAAKFRRALQAVAQTLSGEN